jgi:hypothetical protein
VTVNFVTLIKQWDVQIASKTLFLDVSVKVILKDNSI